MLKFPDRLVGVLFCLIFEYQNKTNNMKTKINYTPRFNPASENVEILIDGSLDKKRMIIKGWQVKDMFKIATIAMRGTGVIGLTGRQAEVLTDMEKWGIVRRPSHTQVEWTQQGVDALMGWIDNQAKKV